MTRSALKASVVCLPDSEEAAAVVSTAAGGAPSHSGGLRSSQTKNIRRDVSIRLDRRRNNRRCDQGYTRQHEQNMFTSAHLVERDGSFPAAKNSRRQPETPLVAHALRRLVRPRFRFPPAVYPRESFRLFVTGGALQCVTDLAEDRCAMRSCYNKNWRFFGSPRNSKLKFLLKLMTVSGATWHDYSRFVRIWDMWIRRDGGFDRSAQGLIYKYPRILREDARLCDGRKRPGRGQAV